MKLSPETRLAASISGVTLGLVALSGCGNASSPELEKDKPATVLDHKFKPASTKFIFAGKVLIPMIHQAEYYLDVRQCDRQEGPGADQDGCLTFEVDVNAQTYHEYPDGSTITFSDK